MNKWLLIWNTVLTLTLLAIIPGGCSGDPRIDWAVAQAQETAATVAQMQGTISQLRSLIDQNSQAIQNSAVQLAAVQSYTQSNIAQLQQYIQLTLAKK